MNQLTYTTARQLPKLVPNLQTLQLSVDYWQKMHADAGSQKEQAWRDYNDAVDKSLPYTLISDMLATAMLFDDICRDTWAEWETAKRNLLDLYN